MVTPSAPEAEYRALVAGCGLLDRSERGKLALSGPDAKAFLNGQTTNDIEALAPGMGCYAAFLTPKGKMLGDLRVLDVAVDGHEQLLLDTERVALQALFDTIRKHKVGYAVELHKRTLERGLLSLIGPGAGRVAGTADSPGMDGDRSLGEAEHANAPVAIDGIGALAVRTDMGVDLICDAQDTERLIAALCARGATAVSEQAAEIVRVERGRPRYGVDMDETTIPQEAGLNERAVSFTKGCYVGQETVARMYYRGKPNRRLRGLRLSAPVPPGAELRLDDRTVGRLTSSVLSPALGPIGLALVRREAQPGGEVTAGEHGARAEVVELPFLTADGACRAGGVTAGAIPAAINPRMPADPTDIPAATDPRASADPTDQGAPS